MFRFRCRVFLPSALLACCLAGPLSAQSGPSGADRTSRPPTGSSVVQTITPQSMATVLKTLDLSVTDVKNLAFDLIEYRVVSKKDGWTYHVDVRVDGRAKLIWLVSPLGEPVKEDQVGSAKLLKLLSMNNVVRPFFFSYRETDRRMCLNFEFANNASTEQFRTGFNLFLDMIRATRPEWDLAQGENGQQGAPPLQVSGKVLEVGKGLKVNGELSKHTKNVTYLVKLEKDKTYVIDMVSPNQVKLDPWLRLLTMEGAVLAEDDDGGEGLNARLTFRAPTTGTYQIIATSYLEVGDGPFTLTVNPKD